MSTPEDALIWYVAHYDKDREMKDEIGPATWNYLHLLAKWTPPNEREKFLDQLRSTIGTFPCHRCGEKGLMWIDAHPLDDKNLEQYMCEFHNAVNEHLDKPSYDCSLPFNYNNPCKVSRPTQSINIEEAEKVAKQAISEAT